MAEVHRLLQPPMTKDQIDQHLKIGPMLVEKVTGHEVQGEKVGLGRHWTSSDNMAETAAMAGGIGGLPVIITARGRSSEIETNPQQLTGHNFSGEAETTFVKGAEFEVLDVQILSHRFGQRWESVWPDSGENRHLPGRHDQSSHAGGKGRPVTTSSLGAMLAVPNGGFTFDTQTGTMVTTGFAVGMSHSVPSLTMKADKFVSDPVAGKKMLADHLEAVARTGDPSIKAGGWHDPDSGMIILDQSTVFPNTAKGKADALTLARSEGEISIAHLDALAAQDYDNAFIPTGGSGNLDTADQRGRLPTHDEGAAVRGRAEGEAPVGDDPGGDRGTGQRPVRGHGPEDRGAAGAAEEDQRELIALLERIESRHKPGGKDHDQSTHGRKGNVAGDDFGGAAALIVPDFDSLSPGLQKKIMERIEAYSGLTGEELDKLVAEQSKKFAEEAIRQYGSVEAAMEQAMFYENWHEREYAFTDKLNETYGTDLSPEQMVAASAALASMTDPASQIEQAHGIAAALAQDEPMSITQKDIDDWNDYRTTHEYVDENGEVKVHRGRDWIGYEEIPGPGSIKPSDLPAGFLASRLSYRGPDGQMHEVPGRINSGDATKAILIMRGVSPDTGLKPGATPGKQIQTLGGAKLREYSSAGIDPKGDSFVIDTWMIRAYFEDRPIHLTKDGPALTPAQIKRAKTDDGKVAVAAELGVKPSAIKVGSGLNSVIADSPNKISEMPKSVGTYPRVKKAAIEATPVVDKVMRDAGYDGPPITQQQGQAIVWAGIRVRDEGMPTSDPFAAGADDKFFGSTVKVESYTTSDGTRVDAYTREV